MTRKLCPINPRTCGFTLLEITIILFIVGILTVPIVQLYTQYLQQKTWSDTKKNVDLAASSLIDFQLNNGRYPCPADRTLPITDANYGKELIDGLGHCIVTAGLCTGSVCRGTNGYDTDNNGTADNVLIGALPFRDLDLEATTLNRRISQKTALDGYHYKIDYAVTEILTESATYNPQRGSVIINQQDGTPAIIQSTTPGVPNRGAHYAVFSHGSDGNGAFSVEGQLFSACGALAAAADNENCNNDAILMQGVSNTFAAGASYYDDYVKYRTLLGTSLWSETSPGAADIMNMNSGNVGINTSVPQERLDVAGILSSDGNIQATQICDATGAGCFSTNVITEPLATAPIKCTGQPLDGISLAAGVCDIITAKPFPMAADQTCPVGRHMVGMDTNGTIVCQ